jgi:TRAP transporter 4TM/12TM fusion protein
MQANYLTEEENKALQIMEEAELGGRKPQGWVRWLVFGLAVSWSLFQLYATYLGTLPDIVFRPAHLGFAFALVFLVYPYGKKSSRRQVPWADWILGLLAVGCAFYVLREGSNMIDARGGFGNRSDILFGSTAIVMLLLGAWRALGPAMPIIAMVFIAYALIGPAGMLKFSLPGALGNLHGGAQWKSVVNQLFMNTGDSIWGTALGVSATTVFVFVLFGALLDRAGAGKFFTDLAFSLLGGFRGGPAKASIIASALNGIVSGSSVSNVVTGGNFTIAAMKRSGYSPEKAGAIEVASSSNGQMMPPVMGAAAFLMADFLQIPYAQLIIMAIIPALLAYGTLLMVADLEAAKLGLRGLPRNELPSFGQTLRAGWHYLVPLTYMIWALVIAQISPERAALNTIFIMLPIIIAQEIVRYTRQGDALMGLRSGGQMILDGLETGARNMVGIAVATGVAGMIIGMVLITNLGTGLTELLEALSFGKIIIALVLAQLVSLLLGMGLPTTANYVVMASLIVPVLLKLAENNGIEVERVQAHMFAFYFGIMADSTPPVALAAYAAAAIAKANPFQTGVQGFIYELRTALLAYMIFFNAELLLVKEIGANNAVTWVSWPEGLWVTLTAFLGLTAFSGFTMGYLAGLLNWTQRILLLVAGLLMLPNSLLYDFIGLGLLTLVLVWQIGGRRKAKGAR